MNIMDIDRVVVVMGSKALMHYVDIGRSPMDSDYIMSYNQFQRYIKDCIQFDKVKPQFYPISNGKKYVVKRVVHGKRQIDEIEIAWEGSTAEELFKIVLNDPKTIVHDIKQFGRDVSAHIEAFLVPSLDILYTLKMSHRYLKNSPHFLKTMKDIQLMRKNGAEMVYPEWFKNREKETYAYIHPALNVKKNDFFQDETFYKYDHDSIHKSIKLYDKPAYTYFLKEGEEVLCDMKKFDTLPEYIKLAACYEESLTLLIERFIVPNKFTGDPYEMFKFALGKVCTSICSGRFREYAWENYDKVVDMYDPIFLDKFNTSIENGTILPFSR